MDKPNKRDPLQYPAGKFKTQTTQANETITIQVLNKKKL